jgi:hypothetical protein
MKCSNCKSELTPGDDFCGVCGQPVSGGVGDVAVADVDFGDALLTEPAPAVPTAGKYTAAISRRNPACLVFLIDQSGSMSETIGGGTGRKMQVVADAINRLLNDTVLRCAKEDGVRPYFDVGAWSYNGAGVNPVFDAEIVSITRVAEQMLRTETRRRKVPDGAGGVFEQEMEMPIWLEPVADGGTPMLAAFKAATAPLTAWLARHPDSFPPIVINLTDGAYNDETPAPAVRRLMQMGTTDGSVLVFNCHVSHHAGMTVPFPSPQQAAGLQGLARELFEMSSPLPGLMLRRARAKGYAAEDGARGYAFNADQVALIDFLDVGTRVADRVEAA